MQTPLAGRRRALWRLGSAAASLTSFLGAGAHDSARIEVGGATLDLTLNAGEFEIGQQALIAWITRCARAVTSYYGRFPVRRAGVELVSSTGRRVARGVSYGAPYAHCRMTMGRRVTAAALETDWELTHEMVHFSFPSVDERHNWIEEGIATYVEPIARASIGWLTPVQVWGDMARDMPQGLPEHGDLGLDNTHTWGRTYWGGALFCLAADVEIRKRTGNSEGLRDALRGINREGGTIEVDWPIDRAFEAGDRATQTHVLTELYKRVGPTPEPVDLPRLWAHLGVIRTGQTVTLDDSAPLARIRRAICGGS